MNHIIPEAHTNMPHLAAIGSQPDELPDVTLAYRIGYADAQAEAIAREAAGLHTIEDVRAPRHCRAHTPR